MIPPRTSMPRVCWQNRVEKEIVMHRSECRALSTSYVSDISQSYRRYCQLDSARQVNRVPLGIIPSLPLFPISSCFRCGVVY
jgi:hypothetical protein